MNPMAILAQVIPKANSTMDAANKAAAISAPPPVNYVPPTMPQAGNMMPQMQGNPMMSLLPKRPMTPIPPPTMTRGEALTSPDIGKTLIGGGY